MAKIDWKFNGVDMIGAGDTTPFSFKLERYKNSSTYEEGLKVYSFVNGVDNGFIVTTIYNLEKDIEQLMRYGVVLSTLEFRDLKKAIEDNYLKLEPVSISLDSDSRFDELIALVKEFIEGESNKTGVIKGELCYVPVNDFNKLAEDCEFYEYEIRALRGQLKDKGYIHTTGNRFAGVTKINDKSVRAIAFKRDKLGVAVPVSKKDKQSKKSDADE